MDVAGGAVGGGCNCNVEVVIVITLCFVLESGLYKLYGIGGSG